MSISYFGAAVMTAIVGIILLVADIEERIGWALFVVGLIAAFVIVIVSSVGRSGRRQR